MNAEYWATQIRKLKDPETAKWGAQVFSFGLGKGRNIEKTNLGEALKYISRSDLIEATLLAFIDWSAQPYCDEILWYFEPDEIVDAYKNLDIHNDNVIKGVADFLEKVESPLVKEI